MKKAAQIDLDWLRQFVDFAQGDPRLTAWEERFVASMRAWAYRQGDFAGLDWDHRLSAKQFEICHQIEDKLLEAEARGHSDEEVEAEV